MNTNNVIVKNITYKALDNKINNISIILDSLLLFFNLEEYFI